MTSVLPETSYESPGGGGASVQGEGVQAGVWSWWGAILVTDALRH